MKQIADLAEVVLRSNCPQPVIEQYLDICQKFKHWGVKLKLEMIKKLFDSWSKNTELNYHGIINELAESLPSDLTCLASFGSCFSSFCTVMKALFSKDKIFEKPLSEIFVNSHKNVYKLVKENISFFIDCFNEIKPVQTESYKGLCSFVAGIFGEWLSQADLEDREEYKRILDFYKAVLRGEFEFNANVMQKLVSFERLHSYQFKNRERTFYEKLFNDLRKRFGKDESYGVLILARAQHLKSLTKDFAPKLTWRQPNGKISGHPFVTMFLKSEEDTFVYRVFGSMLEAIQWMNRFVGTKEKYSFTAIAKRSGNKFEVVLQKGREIFEKKREAYFKLTNELENLTNQLRAFPEMYSKLHAPQKRRLTTDENSNVPDKVLKLSHGN